MRCPAVSYDREEATPNLLLIPKIHWLVLNLCNALGVKMFPFQVILDYHIPKTLKTNFREERLRVCI